VPRPVGKAEGLTAAEARVDESKRGEDEPIGAEPAEARPTPVPPPPEEKAAEQEPPGPSTVVAEIEDSVITRGELEKRLVLKNRRMRESGDGSTESADAESVLLEMLGEKAMIIEGRRGNLLEGDSRVKRFYDQMLVTRLLTKELSDKVKVTEEEINQKLKSDRKLNREQAASMLLKAKQGQAVDEYYEQVSRRLHVDKLRYNFPKVAQAYLRLKHRPQSPRNVWWIRHSQMDEELTQQEKDTPLTTYDGGRVTLMDWFEALNMIPPNKRPKDLNTAEGVERLLEDAMRMPIFSAEAQRQDLAKDPEFLKQIRGREDKIMMSEIRTKLFADLAAPTEREVAQYFSQHRDEFKSPDQLRINQIWCKDRETAQKAKSGLDQGRDFESVKQEYSLSKVDKPFVTSASREGGSFKELWAAEPNEIVGPLRGAYKTEPAWRVVKVIAKTPERRQEYSDNIRKRIESRIRRRRRDAKMAEYQKELLAKYQYKIYPDRIKDIDLSDVRPTARR
jgi:peptidyl-prolyl cis-trans isomerase C